MSRLSAVVFSRLLPFDKALSIAVLVVANILPARAWAHRLALDDDKVILHRNQPDGWVAEIPVIPGCHARMSIREAALAELASVFEMIAEKYLDRGQALSADTTAMLYAWRAS